MKVIATLYKRDVKTGQRSDTFQKEFPNETQMNDWWIDQTRYAPQSLVLQYFEIVED